MLSHSTRKRGKLSSLVLTGPARLTVQRGRLFVEDGFANLGTRRTQEFEPPLMLQSILLLTCGGTWSDHALKMLATNGTPLYALTQAGDLEYCILPPGGAIKPGLLRLQASLLDSELGLTLGKFLLSQKIQHQEQTLRWLSSKAVLAEAGYFTSNYEQFAANIQNVPDVITLRSAEARAAEGYFRAWTNLPIAFQKVPKGCVDVPSQWKRWNGRLSLHTGRNKEATHPLNALLNFAYTVLAAEVLLCCHAASLEPSLGMVHADQDGRPSFVYDVMEPLRPLVDRLLLEMIVSRTFQMNHDFLLLQEGVCRVGIELAAEVGKKVSEKMRPEAEKVVEKVKQVMLSVAEKTFRVPRAFHTETVAETESEETEQNASATQEQPTALPQHGKPAASTKGTCCKCGVKTGKHSRYCEPCRLARFSEICHNNWKDRRESGVDPTHGGEAAKKRGEAVARTRRLNATFA